MRPLLIVSEKRHTQKISEIIQQYGHPAVIDRFIQTIEIDLQVENNRQEYQFQIMRVLLEKKPAGATDNYLVCATRQVESELQLRGFLKTQPVEFKLYSAAELSKQKSGQDKPQFATILNSCGLSIQLAATSILSQWTHSQIDINALTAWKGQFGQLGKLAWIADAILARTSLMSAPELSEHFINSPLAEADVAAFNKDGRGVIKSGEIIANLLTKRLPDLQLLDSPARAIEAHPTGKVVVVEDGLWSGTEAIGVFNSLLGRRPGREKTQPLSDPEMLKDVSLSLVYGMSTDYGTAMLSRYLMDEGLSKISIHSGSTIPLASDTLLRNISDPGFDIETLRDKGPGAGHIKPHLIETLATSLNARQCIEAEEFCRSIGRQLLHNYLAGMEARKSWQMWDDERLNNSALGMHGLGLTHAFGHSVPKATLPLLWGQGPVTWKGRKVDWVPLFANA